MTVTGTETLAGTEPASETVTDPASEAAQLVSVALSLPCRMPLLEQHGGLLLLLPLLLGEVHALLRKMAGMVAGS